MIIGLLFLLHGSSKLFGWPTGEPIPVGTWPFWWAGLIELVVGALVTLGAATRLAALIGSGEMAVAYFWQHWPGKVGASFWPMENGGEVVLLFCFGFLLLATVGGGVYAVDSRRRTTAAPRARSRRWRRG